MGTNDRPICKFVTQWKVYHQQRGFCDLKRTQQRRRLEALNGRNQQHQIYLVFCLERQTRNYSTGHKMLDGGREKGRDAEKYQKMTQRKIGDNQKGETNLK